MKKLFILFIGIFGIGMKAYAHPHHGKHHNHKVKHVYHYDCGKKCKKHHHHHKTKEVHHYYHKRPSKPVNGSITINF